MRRIASALALAALLAPPRAAAQPSTARLDEERRWSTEVSLGRETPLFDGGVTYSAEGAHAWAGMVARRWAPSEAPVGVRVTGWWLQRHAERTEAGGPGTQDRFEIDERIAAVGVAADVAIRLGSRVRLSPSLGVGVVPFAHTRSDYTFSDGTHGRASYRSTGRLWSAGLAVRVGRLVLEQHLIGLLGAHHVGAVRREYYPLTLGWRF